MSAIKFGPIEDAIFAWVLAGSGLPAVNILWYGQNQPARSTPYITLKLAVAQSRGQDWVATEVNPTPSAGAELLQVVRGVRRLTLTVQCFASTPLGALGACSILSDIATAASLPSVGIALNVGGISVADIGDVSAVDGGVNFTVFEPRAVMTATLYAVAEMSETITSIDSVAVQNTGSGEAFVIP